jgi:hypothetical protein
VQSATATLDAPEPPIWLDLRDRPSHNGSDMDRPEWIFGARQVVVMAA